MFDGKYGLIECLDYKLDRLNDCERGENKINPSPTAAALLVLIFGPKYTYQLISAQLFAIVGRFGTTFGNGRVV